MARSDHLTKLSQLVETLRDELENCDQALVSYECGVLDSSELHDSLATQSPMSLDAVHNARLLIIDLLHDLETEPS